METLADRYVLERRLGSGGSATVWQATDKALGVVRAVKVLDVAPGPEREALRERLRREAKAMASVLHPHVVAVHDVGASGDRDFIVMDLVDGPSLADHLDQHGPMSPTEVVKLGVQLLDALAAAHAKGLVHRDVKPGNVLIDSKGNAWLCDFGIALAEATEDRNTRTGTALGSLPYMAPEQRRDARSVGPAADLYAVGCTLYNALTRATPVDLYLAPGRSPRWAGLPEALVPVLRTATAAEPGDRYLDATTFRDALVRASEASDRGEEPPVELTPVHDDVRVRPARSVLWINLAVVGVSVVVAWFAIQQMQARIDEMTRLRAPVVEPAPVDFRITGIWVGPWAQTLGDVELHLDGEPSNLSGELVIKLGSEEAAHWRRSRVAGRWDPANRTLHLEDRSDQPGSGSYDATLDTDGVLKGDFRSRDGGEPVSFALVRRNP